MRMRFLPLLALLFCAPVTLLALTDNADQAADKTEVVADADMAVNNDMNATDLNLQDGAVDAHRRGGWYGARGYYGRGGWYGGWYGGLRGWYGGLGGWWNNWAYNPWNWGWGWGW